jgi:diguanylate cyclase (GGDEF)-like protein
VVLLRECGVLEPEADPELDRWLASVGRATGVAAAALCLADGSQRLVKSVWPAARRSSWGSRLEHEESFEDLLRAMVPGADRARSPVAEYAVVVEGHVVGQLGVVDPDRGNWTTDDLAALADAAQALSAQIEVRLARAEAARAQQLVAEHNRVHDMIARGVPLNQVLTAACEAVERYDPSLLASILQRDPESNTLHSAIGPSFPDEFLDTVNGAPIGPTIGTCGPAAWFGTFSVSENLDEDPNWHSISALARLAGVAHCWSMPIRDSREEVVGTLACYGRAPRRPRPSHVALMQDWARVAGAAIERSRSVDRLTHDARYDSLTGLPNRVATLERLEAAVRAVRPERGLAVLFVDLDGLKPLNDTLGHDVADEMLRTMAQRLSSSVRGSDFVGRLGGDEFVVIAESITAPDEAGRLGARLLEAVARPLTGITSAVLTASIGIALVRSDDVDAREVLRTADEAMYEAKRAGKDRCVFAEIGHPVQAGRRLKLARELSGAETRGELHLVYQPIVSLPDRRTIGVEALLRWTSPEFGDVGPAEFIPIAENAGSIVQIGAWALRESCEAITRLASVAPALELSVNVSAGQLAHPDFPVWVRQTLAHAEFSPARLILDVIDGSLVPAEQTVARNLQELAALGVRIALDDLGAGRLSLSWLLGGVVQAVKIDPCLIGGLDLDRDRAVVGALIGMARDLGCTVTAEGVETEQQLDALQALHCDRAQGFLLARPVSAEDLPGLLRNDDPAERLRGGPARAQE